VASWSPSQRRGSFRLQNRKATAHQVEPGAVSLPVLPGRVPV